MRWSELWVKPERPRSVGKWSAAGAAVGALIGVAISLTSGSHFVGTTVRWTVYCGAIMAAIVLGGNLQFRGRHDVLIAFRFSLEPTDASGLTNLEATRDFSRSHAGFISCLRLATVSEMVASLRDRIEWHEKTMEKLELAADFDSAGVCRCTQFTSAIGRVE